MSETWALVPVKAFEKAKSRLAAVLTEPQRKDIARHMATDVLRVLTRSSGIDRVLIVGQGSGQAELAAQFGCEYEPDDPSLEVSGNVTRVARLLANRGVDTMLTIPADLPGLRVNDLARILDSHQGGVSLYRAYRDGGTNVLIATPPDCVTFSFGQGSARRHAAVARRDGHKVRVVDDSAFQRDIDTPEDLRYLCESGAVCDTMDYLQRSDLTGLICSRTTTAVHSLG